MVLLTAHQELEGKVHLAFIPRSVQQMTSQFQRLSYQGQELFSLLKVLAFYELLLPNMAPMERSFL